MELTIKNPKSGIRDQGSGITLHAILSPLKLISYETADFEIWSAGAKSRQ